MSGADTLVVGLGSIGARHANVLRTMGRNVAVVSRRGGADYSNLDQALSDGTIDYVVIANETSAHRDSLAALAAAGFRGRVLVEKPLFATHAPIPRHEFAGLFVGYNLRFHAIVQRVSTLLVNTTPVAVAAYAGQHLSDWRPGRDYRTTASASMAAGGGVLRDLSHELDYILWLFGPWRRVAAMCLRSGMLDVDTEDVVAILLDCERCPIVTVHLNYHFRQAERRLTVATAQHSFGADLIAGALTLDGRVENFTVARDDTYTAMHRAVLEGGVGACSAGEGLAVVELIEAIERAARERRWVER